MKTRVMLVMVGMLVAISASAQISASAHNFSTTGWATNQICNPCHVPHGGDQSTAPLWAHDLTTNTFVTYSSGTLDANGGTAPQPDAESLACLSCHDGSVALNAYIGGPGGGATMSGSANLGTSLANDHPISFTYDAALATADGELYNPTNTQVTALSGNPYISDSLLFGGKMQCSSCHDVHNTAGIAKMLRFANIDSELCLTCHNK